MKKVIFWVCVVCLMLSSCSSKEEYGEFAARGEVVISIKKINDESYIVKFNKDEFRVSFSFKDNDPGFESYWYEGYDKDGKGVYIVPKRNFSDILKNGVSYVDDKNGIWLQHKEREGDGFLTFLTRRIK